MADNDVSAESNTFVVRGEICRFINRLNYIGKLRETLCWDPRGDTKVTRWEEIGQNKVG
jgi:hypothetical protein